MKAVRINEFNKSTFHQSSCMLKAFLKMLFYLFFLGVGYKLADGTVSSFLEVGSEIWAGVSDNIIIVLDARVLLYLKLHLLFYPQFVVDASYPPIPVKI